VPGLLDEPYYALPAPRTTGNELFHLGHLRDAPTEFGTLPAEDVVGTLARAAAACSGTAHLRRVGAAVGREGAYAFAVLGFLTVHGLPGTDPRQPAPGTRACSVRSPWAGTGCGCRRPLGSGPFGPFGSPLQ
jgi:anhydro-N-acetylmuramic acid kinase